MQAPLLKVQYCDPVDGWHACLVVDSLFDECAGGGVRVSPTTDAAEVEKLARAMTYKLRALGLPLGGAKAGIQLDPRRPGKVDALERFYRFVAPICERYC